MTQKITSNAAQSAATNSSTAELLEALQKAWAENAELKKRLEEKDKQLKKALRAAATWQGKLEKRQKAAAASISTTQPKTAQAKPAVKPAKTEPIVQSTKNDTTTASPAPRSSGRAAAAPEEEPARLSAWAYKREVLVPNLISNIEEHYGAAWQAQWSQDVEAKLDKMEPPEARSFINALNLHHAYYESSSEKFTDVADEWPATAEELYHKIMGDKHDNNKEQGN